VGVVRREGVEARDELGEKVSSSTVNAGLLAICSARVEDVPTVAVALQNEPKPWVG